jgi:RNA polymerase sigma-70 factor (ECF subfamily)
MDRDATRREFSERVEAQLDALYGVALRLTRNATDAEDLVSESVAKAWYAIESLDDWSSFRGWIFRIMKNHFYSGYRKRAKQPEVIGLQDVTAMAEGEQDVASLLIEQSDDFLQWWADPEKEVADRLLGEQIMAALDAIPESYRVTIMLVNIDGLGYDEAAEVLGVPPGTVRSRMKRGRTLLQKALWLQACDAGLVQGTRART